MIRFFSRALGRAAWALLLAVAGAALLASPAFAQTSDVVFLSTEPTTHADSDANNITTPNAVFLAAATANSLTYSSYIGALTNDPPGGLSQYIGANTRVLVLVGVYGNISPAALGDLAAILQTNPGLEVIAFIDGCTDCGDGSATPVASLNLKNFLTQVIHPIEPTTWGAITVGSTIYGGAGLVPVNLNPYSLYASSFSGLTTFRGNYFPALQDVPNDHALYYISSVGSAPAATDTVINNAFGLFIAQHESYGGQGACVFLAADNNMWFPTQDSAIAQTFLDAALQPNGACEIPPTVQITKTSSSTAALNAGDPVTYTITVTNTSTGARSATNVQVSDSPPTGIAAFTSWSCAATGGAACPTPNTGTGAFIQNIASLPAGGSLTYTVNATAETAGLPSIITNTANIDGTDEWRCANGSARPCYAAISNPHTEADMVAGGDATASATVGTPVTVHTTCTNAGPDAAENATCAVTLGNGAITGALNTVCTPTPPVSSLALNGVITCATTLTPAGGTVSLITTAGSDTPDLIPANNTRTTTITAVQADMQASAPASSSAATGAPVTVNTSCTNAGPNDAVNARCDVTVTGPITGAASTTCTPTLPVALLTAGSAISCQTTFTPAGSGTVTVQVHASSATFDPNPANDAGSTVITPINPHLGLTDATAVPTLGEMALALLALLLAGGAAAGIRRKG